MATGSVKFFNKNFGFITNDAGVDVYITLTTLRAACFKVTDMVQGAPIVFETKSSEKGLVVSRIVSIGGKMAQKKPGDRYQPPIIKPLLTTAGQAVIGSLKFYAPARCYGFVEVIDPPGYSDIFFHLDGVRGSVIKGQLLREKMKKGTLIEGVVELLAAPAGLDKIATKRPVLLIDGFHDPHEESTKVNNGREAVAESVP
jgi:cold shock CspA family protein